MGDVGAGFRGWGMLMYEDLWPGWTDLDLAWSSVAQVDTAGDGNHTRDVGTEGFQFAFDREKMVRQ